MCIPSSRAIQCRLACSFQAEEVLCSACSLVDRRRRRQWQWKKGWRLPYTLVRRKNNRTAKEEVGQREESCSCARVNVGDKEQSVCSFLDSRLNHWLYGNLSRRRERRAITSSEATIGRATLLYLTFPTCTTSESFDSKMKGAFKKKWRGKLALLKVKSKMCKNAKYECPFASCRRLSRRKRLDAHYLHQKLHHTLLMRLYGAASSAETIINVAFFVFD